MAHGQDSANTSDTRDGGPGPGDSASGARMFLVAMLALACAVGALWTAANGMAAWIPAVLVIVGLLCILDLGIGARERTLP
jgi:Flp pilus assembly protein TadB